MKTRLLTLALAMGLGLTSAFAIPANPAQARAMTQASGAPVSPETREPQAAQGAYEQREMQSRDLEDFAGGRHEAVPLIVVAAVVVLALLLI
jgi:hypothetical protein